MRKIGFVFYIFFVSEVMAKDIQLENASQLTNLTVKALNQPLADTRRHIAVTVITKEDILKCVGCDFTDVLEKAGVQVRRFHSQFYQSSDTDKAYVSLRGMSDAQIALEVDGVRQQDNMIGEALWPFVPLNHISRIEIIRGPMSAYTGDSAMGGVIRVWTEKADCPIGEVCGVAQTDISNESNTGRTTYLSGSTRTEQSGFRLGVQLDKSGDPEKTNHFREQAFTFNFDHKSKNDKRLIEGGSIFFNSYDQGEPVPDVEKGGSDLVHLGTTYYLSPDTLFKTLLGYNEEQQFYNDDSTEYTSRRLSIKLFGEYHFQFYNTGDYVLTTGVERKRERINSDPDNDVYDYKKRDTNAVFADVKREKGPLTYQVAVRADDLSGDIKEQVWTWDSKASYYVARVQEHDVFLKGGVGTGFRAPGFDEQYFDIFSLSSEEGVVGTLTKANPDLGLEKSTTYEIGIRIERANTYFLDITGFETKLKDSVQFGEKEEKLDNKDQLIYLVPLVQGQETNIRGVEFQARMVLDPLTGRIGYIYTDHSEAVDNLRGINPVKHLGFIGMDYSIHPKFTVGAELLHRGQREDSSIPGDKVNLIGVYAGYDLYENAHINLAIENLTDETYDQYNLTDGPARTVWFSVRLKY